MKSAVQAEGPLEVTVNETQRPGPFDSFSFRDELLADISELLAFLGQLRVQLDQPDLDMMSTTELEYEYQRINRYISARLQRMARRQESVPQAKARIDLAGAHYSPHAGMHISERAG